MPRELALGLRLTADGKGFVGAIRVSEDALKRLRGEAEKGRGATRHYGAASDQVAAGNEKVQRSLLAIHTPLLKYSGYLAGALSLRGLVRHADEFTSIANAVRLATDNTAEFNQVQDALFAIAQRTRAPIAAVADLYQKLTISANELGASQQELLDTVAGVGQALVINGSSAAAASGALLQFSQLLGSARIEAEEFNSLLDGAKPIFQVVADNLDAAGGSVSRLRDLVRQGAVTNKDFFQALQRGLPTLEAAFSQTASTIGQASIQMSNAITRAIGSLDSAVDASDTLAAGISDLAYALSLTAKGELEHDFKRLGYAAGAFLVLIGTRLSPAVLRWTTTAGKAVQANYALHASLGRMTGATASATAGWFVLKRAVVAGQGALAALGGPLGLGLLAAYALYEFAAAGHKARDSLNGLDPRVDDLTLSIDQYRESLERLNRVQLNELISSTAEQLRGLEEGRDQLLAQLARGGDYVLPPGSFGSAYAIPRFDPFDETKIQYLQDQLADLEARIAAAQERQPLQQQVLHQRRNPDATGGTAAIASGQARASEAALGIARRYLSQAEKIHQQIAELEAERERLLANPGGYKVADLNMINRALVTLKAEMKDLEKAPPNLELDSLLARLDARLMATEEGINAQYQAERLLLQTQHPDNTSLLLALEQERNQALADLWEVQARAAGQAQAELIASGLPALEDLRAANERLRNEGTLSLEGIELRNQAESRRIELAHAYPNASEAVLQALTQQHAENDRLLQQQKLKAELLAQYAPEQQSFIERQTALNALYREGALSLSDYNAAQAELRIAQAEGSFADGYLVEIERLREGAVDAAAEMGESFAAVFGPDGTLTQGLAQSAAAALVTGESFRESFGNLARQALQGLIAQLIQLAIQTVLLKTIFAGVRGPVLTNAASRTVATVKETTSLAAQAAYASTAAIPVVGPAAALGAAAKAAVVAAALGVPAITAAKSKIKFAAAGDVIDSPTFFTGRGVPLGVAGEAGPEAILPLGRDRGGRLGVRLAEAGSTQRTAARTVNLNINIQALDSDGVAEVFERDKFLLLDNIRDALADEGRSL